MKLHTTPLDRHYRQAVEVAHRLHGSLEEDHDPYDLYLAALIDMLTGLYGVPVEQAIKDITGG